ncbi:hypothetical protein [Alicyclobacillus shizuokensis]|uniref:hypothetical protein n=1 Tax=Alicyclobacillus shizuokensis TaxID=392014 RepID=UPI00082DA001|nr:hypothetical protein [Alicyclobacillus shizuokensis]
MAEDTMSRLKRLASESKHRQAAQEDEWEEPSFSMASMVRRAPASAPTSVRTVDEVAVTRQKSIQEEPSAPSPSAPPDSKTDTEYPEVPRKARHVYRPGLDPKLYSPNKPVMKQVGIYNREIYKWTSDFSEENQFNGGCAITQSTLIEIILDVVKYDMGLEPIGFPSTQALREYLQSKLK